MSQLQVFLDIASQAALEAGAVLRDKFRNLKNIEEKGRSGDLVTEADKAAIAKLRMYQVAKGRTIPQTVENLQAIMARDAETMEAMAEEIRQLKMKNNKLTQQLEKLRRQKREHRS